MALKTNGLPSYMIATNVTVNGQASRLDGQQRSIIEAEQAITDLDIANIIAEQTITDLDLRLLELEVK